MPSATQKPIEIEITFNKKQEAFLYCDQKYALYGGAKGGGKSFAIRTKQMLRRLKYPGSRGLTLRRTYPELKRTHLNKIIHEWKGLGVFKQNTNSFHFHNGSVQEFGSCQYERDVQNYQGAEYDDVGIDEATQFTEFMFDTLRTNIRTTRTDLKTQIYLGANPGGIGHGWVKRRFIIEPRADDYAFIPAKVYDNHVLMDADPEYAEQLKTLPEGLRRAFLEGDWDIFEGQVLTEWRGEKHTISKLPVSLDGCKKIISFDWGYSAPGCASWIAFAPENQFGVRHAYVYREIYQNQTKPKDWAKQILFWLKIENVSYMVLPHDCFAVGQESNRPAIASTFKKVFGELCPIRRGKTLVAGARHNRLAVLHDFLADATEEPLLERTPYLQFKSNCHNCIRTLPELIYDEHDKEDVDTDGEDHAYDAVTLGLMTEGFVTKGTGGVKHTIKKNAEVYPTVKMTPQGDMQSPDFMAAMRQGVAKRTKGRR